MGLPQRPTNSGDARGDPGRDRPGGEPADALGRFERSPSRRQQLSLVRRLLGSPEGFRCLFVAGGEEDAPLAFHLRAAGGRWVWATLPAARGGELERLLGGSSLPPVGDGLPLPADRFHRIVATLRAGRGEGGDTDAEGLVARLAPALVPGGRIVLVASAPGPGPGGLRRIACDAGLVPEAEGTSSDLLSRTLAPDPTAPPEPLGLVLAALDHLLPFGTGSILALAARRPGRPSGTRGRRRPFPAFRGNERRPDGPPPPGERIARSSRPQD